MREIKFRYRYTDGKNWIMEVFTLAEICNGEPFEVLSDQPLLKNYKHVGQDEYTGLHDKNGKEIYEGDIVKFWGGVSKIIYFDTYAQFMIEFTEGNLFGLETPVEIIGNLYETPELLNNQNK